VCGRKDTYIHGGICVEKYFRLGGKKRKKEGICERRYLPGKLNRTSLCHCGATVVCRTSDGATGAHSCRRSKVKLFYRAPTSLRKYDSSVVVIKLLDVT